MSAEPKPELELELAHLLLIDMVGYSQLLVNEQIELMQELNQIVRNTKQFRLAESAGKLIRLPTGDGMALLFFRSPEEPARCALEISEAIQGHPEIRLRMGAHSGPVNQVTDVNDRTNIAGTGINVAQRVMDCGDAGHILLSKHLAEDLAEYRHWEPHLYDLGECEVKHGLRLHIVNLYKDKLGNPQVPEKFRSVPGRSDTVFRRPKLLLAVVLLLLAAAIVLSFSLFFHRRSTSVRAGSEAAAAILERSIAVLPFENLSDEKQNIYFTGGVQDEIITDLAKVADLKVISRTSTMQYKSGAERNLREIAQALGVAHIVEGSVQRLGARIRVSVQLIDARIDAHLWAEHYDRDLSDVFAIQSEIAEQIVAQLKAKLSPQEKAAIEERPTTDLAAYDLYTRARAIVATTTFDTRESSEGLLLAVSLLDQAINRDPKFFLAYCQLARMHDQIYLFAIDHSPARLALADAAVKNAMRLRPDSGQAHLALAYHLYCGFLDYDRARQELAVAARALPNEPLLFELSGYVNRRQSRWEDATSDLKKALDLDPRNFFTLQQIALAYQALRRYPETVAALDRALALVPNDVGTRVHRANIDLEWRADTKPMHETIQNILGKNPNAAADLARPWFYLALCERDGAAAGHAIAAMTSEGYQEEGLAFPRVLCEALAARARGDVSAAQAAFTLARREIEKTMRDQPDYAQALCVLGIIDAGLGSKDAAINEGRRAVELLPVTKDAINGALLVEYLVVIYAWTGEKDLALDLLATAVTIPGSVNYGDLHLHPNWDLLRNDSRFEKIVAGLAPN